MIFKEWLLLNENIEENFEGWLKILVKTPPTFNNDGKVMNQGSKFIAKIPNSINYLTYDGQGKSSFVEKEEALHMLEKGYQKIPSNWWKKANFLSN